MIVNKNVTNPDLSGLNYVKELSFQMLSLSNSLDLNEVLIYITGLLNLELKLFFYTHRRTSTSVLTKLETLILRECNITMEDASLKLSVFTSLKY